MSESITNLYIDLVKSYCQNPQTSFQYYNDSICTNSVGQVLSALPKSLSQQDANEFKNGWNSVHNSNYDQYMQKIQDINQNYNTCMEKQQERSQKNKQCYDANYTECMKNTKGENAHMKCWSDSYKMCYKPMSPSDECKLQIGSLYKPFNNTNFISSVTNGQLSNYIPYEYPTINVVYPQDYAMGNGIYKFEPRYTGHKSLYEQGQLARQYVNGNRIATDNFTYERFPKGE